MKLRTRLFLSVGILFAIFFTLAYILEGLLVKQRFEDSANRMKQDIIETSRERMLAYQKVVGMELASVVGKIDALLHRLDQSAYFSTVSGEKSISDWQRVAEIASYYPWLNYLQYTVDQELVALLAPSAQDLHPIRYYKIDDSLYWIVVTQANVEIASLAVPIKLKQIFPEDPSFLISNGDRERDLFFLFDPLLLMSLNTIKLDQQEGAFGKALLAGLNHAKSFISQTKIAVQQRQDLPSWIRQRYQDTPLGDLRKGTELSSQNGASRLNAVQEERRESFKQFQEIEDLAVLIGALTSLFQIESFDKDPFKNNPLTGLCTLLPGMDKEVALLVKDLIFSTPYFDDQSFVKSEGDSLTRSHIASSLVAFSFPPQNSLVIGSLLQTSQGDKTGYLTLGVSLAPLLQEVVLGGGRTTLLSYEGKPLQVYSPQGERIDASAFMDAPLDKMGDDLGRVEIGGEGYYYWHLRPYEISTLELYLFEKESEVFATVLKTHEDFLATVNRLSWTMRFVAVAALVAALLFLELIARRITQPITSLASATGAITEGHYEEVKLPTTSKGRKDEIATLCSSFEMMVQGLKDREKVKAVLNKVVSKEIAAEILKHPATLGGEERVVTVLFADIRGFTQMTEKMVPTDVISLLNTCMTKLSHIVDKHGGVIDKYVGDEVMALYGAPAFMKESTFEAIESALEMMKAIEAWNLERQASHLSRVEIGIGINTGTVVAGNMGAEDRLNYTVLGADVNLAARLCSIAAPGEILISEKTFQADHLNQTVIAEKKEPIDLKGFSEKVALYRVTGLKR